MKLQLCFLDFETFWSNTHTLKKMNPIEYCMHPETELQLMSVKIGRGPSKVYVGEGEMRHAVREVDWSDKYVVGHNMSVFDSMLAAWRLGIRPAMWGCTLAMARPLHAKTVRLGLGELVRYYAAEMQAAGVSPVKNSQALNDTKGRKLSEFTTTEIERMRVYNKDDTEQSAVLFDIFRPHFTAAELWHLDCNIRMLIEPRFDLNVGMLEAALSVERSNKYKALVDLAASLRAVSHDPEDGFWDQSDDDKAEWVRAQMASAPKFGALLESRGVQVPLKWSKTNQDKQIPAIAKTDEAMEELLDHEDEVVAAAARARLSVKSTQLETRIQSFLTTFNALGMLPVPAHYCGADTTGRDSGFLYNMLNLPRINPDSPKVSDALRNSVRAPAGKVIMVRDSSGIELRVNHTLWKVRRSMDGWAAKPNWDLYRDTAGHMYTCKPEEVQKPQRHYSKVLELACGYQQGAVTFRQTARVQGGLRLTPAQAEQGVRFWRDRYPEIAGKEGGGWATCHRALHEIAAGGKVAVDPWGLCTTEKDAIVLPSGRRILYPNLRQEWVEQYRTIDGVRAKEKNKVWVYGDGRHRAFIYGGKVDENIVQAMARDIIFGHALQFWRKTRLRPQHKVYDELVYVLDPAEAEDRSAQLGEIMRTPPSYWPELILWSEGDIAETYGAAK